MLIPCAHDGAIQVEEPARSRERGTDFVFDRGGVTRRHFNFVQLANRPAMSLTLLRIDFKSVRRQLMAEKAYGGCANIKACRHHIASLHTENILHVSYAALRRRRRVGDGAADWNRTDDVVRPPRSHEPNIQ